MGRAEHVKKTLARNIRDNPSSEDLEVHFALLNYSSQDDLDAYVKHDPYLSECVGSGVLSYDVFEGATRFHIAHAKNLAAKLCLNNCSPSDDHILVNLDADNFLGQGFAVHIAEIFKQTQEPTLVLPSYKINRETPHEERGFMGRIAMRSTDFLHLGGYPESVPGRGEDSELVIQAQDSGYSLHQIENPEFLKIITHSHYQRVKHVHPDRPFRETEALYRYYARDPRLRRYFNPLARRIKKAMSGIFTLPKANPSKDLWSQFSQGIANDS